MYCMFTLPSRVQSCILTSSSSVVLRVVAKIANAKQIRKQNKFVQLCIGCYAGGQFCTMFDMTRLSIPLIMHLALGWTTLVAWAHPWILTAGHLGLHVLRSHSAQVWSHAPFLTPPKCMWVSVIMHFLLLTVEILVESMIKKWQTNNLLAFTRWDVCPCVVDDHVQKERVTSGHLTPRHGSQGRIFSNLWTPQSRPQVGTPFRTPDFQLFNLWSRFSKRMVQHWLLWRH